MAYLEAKVKDLERNNRELGLKLGDYEEGRSNMNMAVRNVGRRMSAAGGAAAAAAAAAAASIGGKGGAEDEAAPIAKPRNRRMSIGQRIFGGPQTNATALTSSAPLPDELEPIQV